MLMTPHFLYTDNLLIIHIHWPHILVLVGLPRLVAVQVQRQVVPAVYHHIYPLQAPQQHCHRTLVLLVHCKHQMVMLVHCKIVVVLVPALVRPLGDWLVESRKFFLKNVKTNIIFETLKIFGMHYESLWHVNKTSRKNNHPIACRLPKFAQASNINSRLVIQIHDDNHLLEFFFQIPKS